MQTRSIYWNGKTYHVRKLYSSGLGNQYAVSTKEDQKEVTTLLTSEFVEKNPSWGPLFERATKLFDDHLTFAKYLGSTSFDQSRFPPDGLTKSDKP